MKLSRVGLASLVGLALCSGGCGNAAPPAPTAPAAAVSAPAPSTALAEPPDDPVPRLRAGTLEPEDTPTLGALHVTGRHVADGYETLELELPLGEYGLGSTVVSVDAVAGQPAPFAFIAVGPWRGSQREWRLWVRRLASDGPVAGDLYLPAVRSQRGRHARFEVADPHGRKSDPAVRVAWLRALAEHFTGDDFRARTPWTTFAAARLDALADALDVKPKAKAAARPRPALGVRIAPRQQARDDLAQLMDTTTGATAVQEALQQNRALFLQAAREKPSAPIASLQPPPLAHHPWKKMMTGLGAAPAEPFAADAPADFYFVRAADLPALFSLLDQIDAWGTPAANVLDGFAEERDIAARYEAQLGLRRTALTRALGPSVVGQVAVVGSDPYFKEGSDVTVLLRVKNRSLLDAALAATLGELEQAHGKLLRETRDHGGVAVSAARSADGAVHQQRAAAGDVEVVSNSAAAIDAVLDTIAGRHARLADEPDFQFMLARDASERADVLAYMGDRFVGQVVGPRQKVLEARREIALGELMVPGFAALLFGVEQGKSPARVEDLVAAGLLAKDEMAHAGGAPIAWSPGAAARSSWGTPAAMTPLIDLPAPEMVTPSEKASYERFARSYQDEWSAYVDPVALRFAFDGHTVAVAMRELPLIDGTQYRDVADFVGKARFASSPVVGGARIVAGVGADSRPRREAIQTLRGFSHELTFDWLGDWAAVGVADRSVLAQAFLAFDDETPRMPEEGRSRSDAYALLPKLPVYAEIAVKSTAQAALALGALRVLANETIPGMFEWGEAARHRGVPIVRITIKKEIARDIAGDAPEVRIYYAVTEGALIVTLHQWLIERLVDEQLDGTGPTFVSAADPSGLRPTSRQRAAASPAPEESAQLALDIACDPGKALASTIGWLLEAEVLKSTPTSRANAEALLRGAPETAGDAAAVRALGLAYFGAAPVTPDGAAWVLTKQGLRDPARGTAHAPVYPEIPVPGSPVNKVIEALARVRTQLAFDDEGKDDAGKTMRSLHARATFGLR
jgi:hypothetical protein